MVRVPDRIGDFSAHRVGSSVYLRLTIPSANSDGVRPADLDRVDIYGYTGSPTTNDEFVKRGTLVARIDVRAPEPPPEADGTPAVPSPPGPGLEQGAVATSVETLTPELMVPLPSEKRQVPAPSEEPRIAQPLAGSAAEAPLARLYVAVGLNHRGRKGPFSARLAVPLVPPPAAPGAPTVNYTAGAASITWAPAAGARRPVQPAPPDDVLPSKPLGNAAASTGYNVYEAEARPSAQAEPAGTRDGGRPSPINEKPIAVTSFEDPKIQFGTERCYAVSTIDAIGALQIESELSTPTCITPKDTFAPAAPRSLAAVAGDGAISLIWEANTERDLGGYLVLRGESPGETLRPLTTTPVRETTYRDSTARPGVRYVYAVVAVDTAKPANVSAESARVEETARE